MKVIIAGSRDIVLSVSELSDIVAKSGFEITEVVSGTCRGIDVCGEEYALVKSLPVKQFPAEWKKYFGRAGGIRNAKMAAYADALIAIPGVGPGTKDMIAKMKSAKKLVYVYYLEENT